MTQRDPRSSTITTPSTPSTDRPPAKQEPPFNWRVSVGMAIGLLVLFGLLFALRAFDIFPPRPGEDPEIAAARATLAALPTPQAAPAAQPTAAPTTLSAPAPLGPIVLATPAPTSAATVAVTAAPAPTIAPTPALVQQPAIETQERSTVGGQFETGPTPVATTTSDQATPTVATIAASSAASDATPTAEADASSAQPTPIAINLPANLANAILQGYENYWSVRVNAMRDPADTTIDLESTMAGTELGIARKTIADYRSRGEAYNSDVHHQIWITFADASEATVVDIYTVTSQPLNPETKEPLDSAPIVEHARDKFQLQVVDGVWKVVDEPPED